MSRPARESGAAPSADWKVADKFELDEPIASLAYSADGRILFAGTYSGRVVLWEVSTRTRVLDLKAHDGPIESLALSPEGRHVATGGRDTQVGIWALKPDGIQTSNLDKAIEDLGEADTEGAYRAIWTIAEGGKSSQASVLSQWSKSGDAPIDALISQLDAALISDRENAKKMLYDLDVRAEPRIRERMQDRGLPADVRVYLSQALSELSLGPSKRLAASGLRRQRLFQAIEFMSADVAEPFLTSLLAHESETVRRMAAAALNRMAQSKK